MAEIHALPIPVIAAIHGACLGGGLELALAWRWSRLVLTILKTVLGLPEAPGSGGTQRLPRLIGVSTALEMILTGKQLRAKQALKLGLVDDVVPHSILLESLLSWRRRIAHLPPLPVRERILAGPLGRALLFKMVGTRKQNTKLKAIIRRQNASWRLLKRDQRRAPAAVMTPKSGVWRTGDDATIAGAAIFFASTDVKKDPGSDAPPAPLNSVGILGGGSDGRRYCLCHCL